jgi:hypothetical protein
MKKYLLKVSAVLSIAMLFSTTKASAQDQIGEFLKVGVDDGNKLINAYMSPMMKGFAQGLNDGWCNTAKPLGLGGFDVKFNLGASMVPTSDQSFNFNNIGLNTDPSKARFVLPTGTNPNLSTLYGANDANAPFVDVMSRLTYTPPGSSTPKTIDTSLAKIQLPTGKGIPYTPSLPMAQLSVGLVKKTEVMIRFFPQTAIGSFKAGMFGLGFKHDIKQWIPGIKNMPGWDWSVFVGYTSFSSEYIMGQILSSNKDTSIYNPDPSIKYDNQKLTFSGSAYTVGTIISKKLLFFTPYIGVNYAYSTVNMKLEGNYPIPLPNDKYQPIPPSMGGTNYNPHTSKIFNTVDPVNLTGTLSNFRANVGFRLKLTIFTISAEYIVGAYSSLTASVALNIQSLAPPKL